MKTSEQNQNPESTSEFRKYYIPAASNKGMAAKPLDTDAALLPFEDALLDDTGVV